MSQQTGTDRPTATGAPAPRAEVARDEAEGLGRTAADASRHVAGVAGDQASAVAGEARRQAKDLLGEARTQAGEQARAGQQRAAEGLRSLAGELQEMSSGGDRHGPASDLAAQAAERIDGLAGWLDRHEPGDLLREVRTYARRRPGTFLLGAAVAGVLAGRLTRGAVDAQRDSGSGPSPQQAPYPVPGGPAGAGPGTVPYASPTPAGPPPHVAPPAPVPLMPPGPPSRPPVSRPPVSQPPMSQPPVSQPPMPQHPTSPPPVSPPPGFPPGPAGAPAGQPGGPGYPPPAQPGQQPPRPGPSTVGEYVEEIGQGGRPRHELRDPRDRS